MGRLERCLGTSTPRRSEDSWSRIPRALSVLEIHDSSVRHFAHNGYVYCMLMAKGPTVEVDADDDVLISGGGDGTIKLWTLGRPRRRHADDDSQDDDGQIHELMTLGTDNADSVLALALDGSFLYAGKLDGIVELWDLDTTQRLRVIKAHGADVMSLHMGWGYLWTASANGCASVSLARPPAPDPFADACGSDTAPPTMAPIATPLPVT